MNINSLFCKEKPNKHDTLNQCCLYDAGPTFKITLIQCFVFHEWMFYISYNIYLTVGAVCGRYLRVHCGIICRLWGLPSSWRNLSYNG